MFTFDDSLEFENELARLTDIAYQAMLKQGISRPFVEVELELWQQIRAAYCARDVDAEILGEVA
jgi:hypothetical protein